jgi:hypothetical protein
LMIILNFQNDVGLLTHLFDKLPKNLCALE